MARKTDLNRNEVLRFELVVGEREELFYMQIALTPNANANLLKIRAGVLRANRTFMSALLGPQQPVNEYT